MSKTSEEAAQRADELFDLARFRYGDVMLHDGAETGTRLYAPGDERSVFNVFELFEPSDFVTHEVHLEAPGDADIAALASACDQAKVEFEGRAGGAGRRVDSVES
jgi:hypothetical protein